ncbi:MAG: hypothetical protein Q7R78_01160 [bacterium]|nr:hypothetical protein [bacterium]
MINAEVTKNHNESPASIIRRFTRKVQGAGILSRVRGIRYSSRKLSHYKVKQKTLESLTKKANFMRLVKMGKIIEKTHFSK